MNGMRNKIPVPNFFNNGHLFSRRNLVT